MLKKSSVAVAKTRLKMLVTSDRVCCAPDDYDNICRELYQALSKYLEITEDDFKDDNGWFSSEFEGQEVLVKYAIHNGLI